MGRRMSDDEESIVNMVWKGAVSVNYPGSGSVIVWRVGGGWWLRCHGLAVPLSINFLAGGSFWREMNGVLAGEKRYLLQLQPKKDLRFGGKMKYLAGGKDSPFFIRSGHRHRRPSATHTTTMAASGAPSIVPYAMQYAHHAPTR